VIGKLLERLGYGADLVADGEVAWGHLEAARYGC